MYTVLYAVSYLHCGVHPLLFYRYAALNVDLENNFRNGYFISNLSVVVVHYDGRSEYFKRRICAETATIR